MPSVQSPGRFNDRWRRTVTTRLPIRHMDRRTTSKPKYTANGRAKFVAGSTDRRQKAVVAHRHCDRLANRRGASRHENRRHHHIVARLMEILKIKRIVAYLIDRASAELRFTHLELDHEHHVIDQRNDIDAFTKPGNRILEIDLPTRPIRLECGL